MCVLKPLLSFTRLAHQRNSDTKECLKVTSIVEEIQGYVERTERECLTHLAFCQGQQDLGQPEK
jgi:hypothetical protein